MNFGLAGAHRVGKTSLAAAAARETGRRFVQGRVGHVFSKLGLRPDQALGWSDRMKVQWAILEEHKTMWAKADCPFITDRTPVDFIGYMMTEAGPQARDCDEFRDYLTECYDAANFYFGGIMLVQPGIELAQADLKGAMTDIHIENLNLIMRGTLQEEALRCRRWQMSRGMTDFQARVDSVIDAWDRVIASNQRPVTLAVH